MLSPAQQRAVETPGHLLVTACPGSGKTHTLAHRAANLLRLQPRARLAAVTFTNEAAAELRSRIVRHADGAESRVVAGTFHRLAKVQLMKAGVNVRLASAAAQAGLLHRAFAQYDGEAEIAHDAAVAYIERVKSRAEAPRPVASEAPLHEVYLAYETLLRRAGLMDFSDLLLNAVRGMADGSVEPLKVTFMLVDEFQDADALQISWVLAHAANGTHITTVGDDDQSIYQWRNALGYEGFERFTHSTHASHVSLDMTYRCGRDILAHAARLIAHNSARVPKELRSAAEHRGSIEVLVAANRGEEAQNIAYRIAQSRAGDGKPSWAVLARTNMFLNGVERAMTQFKVAHVRVGGRSFWEEDGAAMLLEVLRSLDARTITGIEHLLHACKVSEADIGQLMGSDKRGGSSLERFARLKGRGSGAGATLVRSLRAMVRDWLGLHDADAAARARGDEEDAGIAGVVIFAVADWLRQVPALDAMSGDIAAAGASLARMRGSLAQRLSYVTRSRDREPPPDAVTLMTLHASKGREFDCVWIAGCEDGLTPYAGSPIEEERRLFYVGMTRARHSLILSVVKDSARSPFLQEAGLDVTT